MSEHYLLTLDISESSLPSVSRVVVFHGFAPAGVSELLLGDAFTVAVLCRFVAGGIASTVCVRDVWFEEDNVKDVG